MQLGVLHTYALDYEFSVSVMVLRSQETYEHDGRRTLEQTGLSRVMLIGQDIQI